MQIHGPHQRWRTRTGRQEQLMMGRPVVETPGLADNYLVPMPTLCTVWNNLPSVLMLGAMMISVS